MAINPDKFIFNMNSLPYANVARTTTTMNIADTYAPFSGILYTGPTFQMVADDLEPRVFFQMPSNMSNDTLGIPANSWMNSQTLITRVNSQTLTGFFLMPYLNRVGRSVTINLYGVNNSSATVTIPTAQVNLAVLQYLYPTGNVGS